MNCRKHGEIMLTITDDHEFKSTLNDDFSVWLVFTWSMNLMVPFNLEFQGHDLYKIMFGAISQLLLSKISPKVKYSLGQDLLGKLNSSVV